METKDGDGGCRAGSGEGDKNGVASPDVVDADARGIQLEEEATMERRIKMTRSGVEWEWTRATDVEEEEVNGNKDEQFGEEEEGGEEEGEEEEEEEGEEEEEEEEVNAAMVRDPGQGTETDTIVVVVVVLINE